MEEKKKGRSTLGKKVTSTFYRDLTEEESLDPVNEGKSCYDLLKEKWSSLHYDRENQKPIKPSADLGAHHYLLYSILMGRNYRDGFSPITNAKKKEFGALGDDSLESGSWKAKRALAAIKSDYRAEDLLAPFKEFLAPEALEHIRSLVNFEFSSERGYFVGEPYFDPD
jgi:hypothetical protein